MLQLSIYGIVGVMTGIVLDRTRKDEGKRTIKTTFTSAIILGFTFLYFHNIKICIMLAGIFGSCIPDLQIRKTRTIPVWISIILLSVLKKNIIPLIIFIILSVMIPDDFPIGGGDIDMFVVIYACMNSVQTTVEVLILSCALAVLYSCFIDTNTKKTGIPMVPCIFCGLFIYLIIPGAL